MVDYKYLTFNQNSVNLIIIQVHFFSNHSTNEGQSCQLSNDSILSPSLTIITKPSSKSSVTLMDFEGNR